MNNKFRKEIFTRETKRRVKKSRKAIEIVFAAMLLTFVFAATIPTAAAGIINVDGYNESAWADAKCVDDATGEIGTLGTPYFVNGYDIARFCVLYDQLNDTLYFKIEINETGVPGDTDGDGNPNATSDLTKPDNFEVGASEFYEAWLDIDGDCNMDYKLEYTNNVVAMKNYTTLAVIPGTTSGSIGSPPYTNTVVEMSFSPAHNLSRFGACNTNFSAKAHDGNPFDGLGEDETCKFLVNKAPVPIPVGEDVCLCTNTTFNGSASYDPDGSIVWWHWDFGDGNTSSGATMSTTSHHYGAAGTYMVNLTVTDDYGFVCSNTTSVDVYENPKANFTATEVCFCTDTQFNDTTTGGTAPYKYMWDFGDGNTSTEQNPTNHYPAPGDYTVKLNVTDVNNCTDEITKNVTVISHPNISIVKLVNGEKQINASLGETVTFTLNVTNTGKVNITNLTVIDVLPRLPISLPSLSWADAANITQDSVTPNPDGTTTIIWHDNLTAELPPGGFFVISFNATVSLIAEPDSVLNNSANVTGESDWGDVYDEDEASVKVKFLPRWAIVDGYVYEDLNCNCIYDIEPGVVNVTVDLVNTSTGLVVNTTKTAAFGYYVFNNVAPGDYWVRYNVNDLPAHLSPKCDDPGDYANPTESDSFTVPTGGTHTHNFGVKSKPSKEVPVVTPIGIAILVGLLSLVAVSSIKRKRE